MRFDKYIPCDSLKPYVAAFAVSENEAESTYKVLPDTGVVIGFQYRGRLSLLNERQAVPLETSGITGLQDCYRVFRNAAHTGTVLVYFREAGAAAFFREPVHELFRASVSLNQFMLRSELLLLEEQLCEAGTDTARIKIVEWFLLARLRSVAADELVLAALALIHRHKGIIRIKELADQLHTSPSPLEKRFRSAVGTSAKKFASIVRFRFLLRQYNPANSLTELGYEAGFYDQAHFIKAFKGFTGETPEAFFGNH